MTHRFKGQKAQFSQFDTPATKLLEKRRMMYEVHENYQFKLKEFEKEELKFQEEEEKIRKDDLEIQEKLIKYWKILRENERKRKRASDRYDAESKLCMKRRREIEKLQNELRNLENSKKRREQKLESLKKYEAYLREVIEENSQYSDITELRGRYENLEKQNDDLEKQKDETEDENENLNQNMHNYIITKRNEIQQLNNEIQKHTKLWEQKRLLKTTLQQEVEQGSDLAFQLRQDKAKVRQLIDQLEQRCLDEYNMLKKFKLKNKPQFKQQKQKPEGQEQDKKLEKKEKEEKEHKKKTSKKDKKGKKDGEEKTDEANKDEQISYISLQLSNNYEVLQGLIKSRAPKNGLGQQTF